MNQQIKKQNIIGEHNNSYNKLYQIWNNRINNKKNSCKLSSMKIKACNIYIN